MVEDRYRMIEVIVAQIEAEMRRIGYWQETPLTVEQYDFHAPFAMDRMDFTQWLQFILIPRVKTIVEKREAFPKTSSVAVQAIREYDGVLETDSLISLLNELDQIVTVT